MFVRVDLPAGTVSLEEPEDCRRFHLLLVGAGDGGAPAALDAALRAEGVGRLDEPVSAQIEGVDAWVAIDAVRRLAAGRVGEGWEADLEGMLAYASSKGWLDDEATHVRAHVERPGADA